MAASALRPRAIDLSSARLRDAPRVGLAIARANEAEARGVRRGGGRRPVRLHRVRATYPPRPLRLYLLVIANVLEVAVTPTWIGRTPDDVAAVTMRPLAGPDTRRYRRRQATVIGTAVVVMTSIFFTLFLLQPLTLVVFGLAFAPIAWAAVATGAEAMRTGDLRRQEEAVVAEAPGPVHLATGLAGGGKGAGTALMHAVTDRADAEGITLVARTERGPLVALYQRDGFHVVDEVATWWGFHRPHRATPPTQPGAGGRLSGDRHARRRHRSPRHWPGAFTPRRSGGQEPQLPRGVEVVGSVATRGGASSAEAGHLYQRRPLGLGGREFPPGRRRDPSESDALCRRSSMGRLA